jgi:hypothetical protein
MATSWRRQLCFYSISHGRISEWKLRPVEANLSLSNILTGQDWIVYITKSARHPLTKMLKKSM